MATTAPPANATNAELVRWAFDALDRHDIDALKPLWSDETVERFPQETCVGAEAIAGYFEALIASVPDMRMKIVDLAADGDHVFVQWHLTGTFTGAPFRGIAPTGRSLAVDGIDHFTLRDGNVVSNFVVADQLQFARQIGMLPEEGTPADRAMTAAFNAKTRLAERMGRRR